MSRLLCAVCAALLSLCASLRLGAASPPQPASTPAATTSSDCPLPAADTQHFLSAPTLPVRVPRGVLQLVGVASEAARERGLMCVVRIPPDRGMIFVFGPPDREQAFWMKNTLVGLDMVFVRASGTVSSVAAAIPPTPDGTPDERVERRLGVGRFVIELGSGEAARHGIVRGTKLALPALSAQQ